MKGIVLSGGKGTRLRPITHTGPKQLVPVANKPVLQYAIEDLKEAGISEIGVVVGNLGRDEIQEFLGDGSKFGVDITYIVQGNPLGISHAVGCARSFVGDDDFVIYLGDNILKQGITELVDSFNAGEFKAGIALQRVDNPSQFGVAVRDADGNVTELIEKPDTPPSDLALIGIYVFSPDVFRIIEELEPSWRGELEITDAIQTFIEEGHTVDSHLVQGWWKDTGKPKDILEANRLVLAEHPGAYQGTAEPNAETLGHIDLHADAVVESDATIRGPASIGANTVIKAGTYIGPYTSIGPNSVIQGTHIENSVIIGESEITSNGKIVDSLIGRGTRIDSAENLLPDGRRLIIGENSNLKL